MLTLRAMTTVAKEPDFREDLTIDWHIAGIWRIRGNESIVPSQSGEKIFSKKIKKEQSEK